MHSERDKFLYEAMGMKATYLLGDYKTQLDQKTRRMNGFSDWSEFGLLLQWVTTQEWRYHIILKSRSAYSSDTLPLDYINPDKFANVVYEFLLARAKVEGVR